MADRKVVGDDGLDDVRLRVRLETTERTRMTLGELPLSDGALDRLIEIAQPKRVRERL